MDDDPETPLASTNVLFLVSTLNCLMLYLNTMVIAQRLSTSESIQEGVIKCKHALDVFAFSCVF